LEFATSPDYVFGYLYIGSVLLANTWLSRRATLAITSIAAFLTILNIWVPGLHAVSAATIASRLIAVLALGVTGLLSDRNRRYAEAIAQQEAKLHAQEELSKVREDFVSTLTHDLKTPLLGAIETINAFQKEAFGAVTGTQKKVLATMARSHHTSLELVETLLDVYRNDIQGLQLRLEPVDLVVLAEESVMLLRELAMTRQIHLRLTYEASEFRRAFWVKGDAFQLRRVFTNLIANAINYSFRGSLVEIVLESHPSHHVVKIIDAGGGISTAELPHLFERFYQGDDARQVKGSGLGLYLTRQIVEAHGGKIWAENHVTKGATFSFRLPVFPLQFDDLTKDVFNSNPNSSR
jgi:two-component system NarL family sensor kinase